MENLYDVIIIGSGSHKSLPRLVVSIHAVEERLAGQACFSFYE